MKIKGSEISKGSMNKRARRKTGLQGGIITFTTDKEIFKGSVVEFDFGEKMRFYKVEELVAINDKDVEVTAVEYGDWRGKLSRQKDFDVRKLIGLEVSLVTDEAQLKQLEVSSTYC